MGSSPSWSRTCHRVDDRADAMHSGLLDPTPMTQQVFFDGARTQQRHPVIDFSGPDSRRDTSSVSAPRLDERTSKLGEPQS